MSATGQGSTPAGWYPDGQAVGQERYWDGSQWTDHFRPIAGAPAYPPQPPQPQYAPVPAYAAPSPAAPSAFGIAFKEYWAATVATVKGGSVDAIRGALSIQDRGGSPLFAWLIPLAINSIVFGFFLLAVTNWYFAGYGFLFGGALAGTFFLGVAVSALYLFTRALAVRITASRAGERLAYPDALKIATTAHVVDPYPLALMTLAALIPGVVGIIIVSIIGGVTVLTVLVLAETAIYAATTQTIAFPKPPLIAHALSAGLSYGIVGLIASGSIVGVIIGSVQAAYF